MGSMGEGDGRLDGRLEGCLEGRLVGLEVCTEPEPYPPIFSFLRLGTSSLATALVAKTVAAKAILKYIFSVVVYFL